MNRTQHAIAGSEHWTSKPDGARLFLWNKCVGDPKATKGTILFVHGSSMASQPTFDLQVPGLQRSVMTSLSQQGYAAYAVDLRGYGETRRDVTGWLTPKRSTADVVNVLSWVSQQHPNLPRPALLGWSRGGAVAMLAAQTMPQRVSALILFGFAYDPDQDFIDPPPPSRPLMLKNTAAAAASDFVSPKVTPKAVVDAFVAQALRADPITMDLKNDGEFNVLDPARVTVPTLVLFGEHDINVPIADGAKFFGRLASADKQMVELAGADHAAQLEDTHDAWIAAVVNFIARPSPRR